jgi:hypothetical protein
MPNAWIAVSALVAAISTAWVILFAQGVPAAAVVAVTLAGLAAFGVVARWGRRHLIERPSPPTLGRRN